MSDALPTVVPPFWWLFDKNFSCKFKILPLDVETRLTAAQLWYIIRKSISTNAQEAMAWAVSARLIQGKGGNRLDPQGFATRAEMAAIVQRLDTLLMDKVS